MQVGAGRSMLVGLCAAMVIAVGFESAVQRMPRCAKPVGTTEASIAAEK